MIKTFGVSACNRLFTAKHEYVLPLLVAIITIEFLSDKVICQEDDLSVHCITIWTLFQQQTTLDFFPLLSDSYRTSFSWNPAWSMGKSCPYKPSSLFAESAFTESRGNTCLDADVRKADYFNTFLSEPWSDLCNIWRKLLKKPETNLRFIPISLRHGMLNEKTSLISMLMNSEIKRFTSHPVKSKSIEPSCNPEIYIWKLKYERNQYTFWNIV